MAERCGDDLPDGGEGNGGVRDDRVDGGNERSDDKRDAQNLITEETEEEGMSYVDESEECFPGRYKGCPRFQSGCWCAKCCERRGTQRPLAEPPFFNYDRFAKDW